MTHNEIQVRHDVDHEHLAGEVHDHDLGLSHDLPRMLSRRGALAAFGGLGIATLAGCASAASSGGTGAVAVSPTASPSPSSSTTTTSSTDQIPEETAGPYPADGSNGRNVLNQSGIVRSDITSSFGTASGVVTGVPLTVTLAVLDVSNGAAPLEGAAVYLWHATPGGEYSMYSQAIQDENYLRGVQAADTKGQVTFTTVYPGAYDGRWPHLHFEVYPSLDAAVSASSRLRTSQMAMPEDTSTLVYATDGYGNSAQNLAQSSLETDMVFSDGWSLQLGKVIGSVTDGLTATLNVPV
jgi:protocatechuate 3,4-dioxygenase beta subunit